MKILLAAVNAKYIHSNLAVYCLKAYAKRQIPEEELQIEIAEYTINQQLDDMMRDIYEQSPDVLCISCYIWNLTYVEQLARELGKLRPDMPIWLGGPEVSYDAADVLRRLPEVKGVIKGEGEITFTQICQAYQEGEDPERRLSEIAGVTIRTAQGGIVENPWREPMDLSCVPFVYEDMQKFQHKIVYYETSRGCPFSCSYCLSSIDKKLRFRDLKLVERELQFFLDQRIPQVKFVDRTFNCKHEHAMTIWKYLAQHDNGVTNFHFEISADLLNQEELELLASMRPGLVQLEIGVQSTNPDTIREIRRTMNLPRLREVVLKIEGNGNVHQHLDLIAGLPYEDIKSFARSFDEVYAMRPQQLQLGFLKVLKGSCMQERQQEYGLVYKSAPPYEVLCTKWLSYEDVLLLKGVEEMVEVYYNSRQFEQTLERLTGEYESVFAFYEKLWAYYRRRDLHNVQHKRSARYEILYAYIKEYHAEEQAYYRELLIYDYYLRENAKSRPAFAGEPVLDKERARRVYEQQGMKQMRKMTHLEEFPLLGKTVLFDYRERNPLNQEAKTSVVG